MAFMLVNVFFGIIGTFWLRMQNRKGEIGLRMALGAHRITLERYMYTEGLCLLAFTLPLLSSLPLIWFIWTSSILTANRLHLCVFS